MTEIKVAHYPSCSGNYPEKPEGEPAQKIEAMDIGEGETVYTCVDCGAFIVVEDTPAALVPDSDSEC